MKFKAIKSLLGAVAPGFGQALGGPLGGAAAQANAGALGCASDEKSITAAVQKATPEQLTQIKTAELDFQARMKELDVDIFALENKDRADARAMFGSDWTPKVIGIMCVSFFGAYIALITIQDPAANDDGIVNLVLGYLGGIVSSIISFYYSVSHQK